MRDSLLAALACAAVFLLAPSVLALQDSKPAEPAKPTEPAPSAEPSEPVEAPAPAAKPGRWLEFGRAALKLNEVELGSKRTALVRLQSVGSEAAHVAKVSIRGEGVAASITFKRVKRPVVAGAALDPILEIEPGKGLTLELTIDPAGQKVGAHAALVEIECDGSETKVVTLPVDWEVVEKEEQQPAPQPAAHERQVLTELRTKGPQPRLDIEPVIFDFGHVMLGETVKTSFKITNRGEGDLILQRVSKQCHCTLPHLILPGGVVPKTKLQDEEMVGTLKKGEVATLEVEIDTTAMGGVHEKQVTVFTNDLTNNPFAVKMRLNVENPFQFTPSSVYFDSIRHGANARIMVRMTSADDVGPFSIVGHELPQPPAIDVEYRRVKARKGEVSAWEITCIARDDAPCKKLYGKLKLILDHPRLHGVTLDYGLNVLPDIDWIVGTLHSPEMIALGLVKPGQNDVRPIILENKNEAIAYVPTAARVESRLGTDWITTEIVPLDAGKRYEVRLKIIKPPPSPAFSGELVVASDHPTVKELHIKFSGLWRDR